VQYGAPEGTYKKIPISFPRDSISCARDAISWERDRNFFVCSFGGSVLHRSINIRYLCCDCIHALHRQHPCHPLRDCECEAHQSMRKQVTILSSSFYLPNNTTVCTSTAFKIRIWRLAILEIFWSFSLAWQRKLFL